VTSREDRSRGAILGVLVGDALGVPVEGMGRDEFRHVEGMQSGGSHGMPAGTWSDAGSLTLLTLESLVAMKGFDAADLGDRFLRWHFNRHWTARRVALGIGFTTREAIVRIREGKPAADAGLTDEDNNGSGSLKRMLPIVLHAHARGLSPRDTGDLVHRASKITHAHPRAMLCCGLYALFLRALLEGKTAGDALEAMRTGAVELYASDPWNQEYRAVQNLMERNPRFLDRYDVKSSGYVVETLEAAIWCVLQRAELPAAVLEAVNLGGDSDGVAAVTGSLSGAIEGAGAIPEAWRKELARIDEIEELVARFLVL
jgi:ADP-ribosylglycohydrolase